MIVFVDDDLRGARLMLHGPDSILDLKRDRPNGMDWGDVISSVEVRERRASGAPGECRDYPYLFDNDGFGGGKQRIDRSVENLHRSGWGDRASSLCVPDRWVLVFYLDSGFRGERLEIRGPQAIHDLKRDRPQGRDWGDQISSVEIRRSR
jgi:hypothetical protein